MTRAGGDQPPGRIGSDGLNPVERLLASGHALDEKGRTLQTGYQRKPDGPGRDYSNPVFASDPWEWLDDHDPDLTLYCATTRLVIAVAWRTPFDEDGTYRTWYRSTHYQGSLDDQVDDHGNLPMHCPEHGLVLQPATLVRDQTASERKKLNVPCTDPHPEYRSHS